MCAGQEDVLQRHSIDVLDLAHPIGLYLKAIHREQLGAIVAGHIVWQALALEILRCRLIATIFFVPATGKTKLAQLDGRQHLAGYIENTIDAQIWLKVGDGRILAVDTHPLGWSIAVRAPVDLEKGVLQGFARQRNG